MSKPEVRVFPSLEELSHAAAALFTQLASCRANQGKSFSVGLSGGSTPRRLYELLGSAPYSAQIPWGNVHLFQVDERCVPPDHPDSNYRVVREALLDRVPLPEANFHRMAVEQANLEDGAREYAAELARLLRPPPGQPPRLDLAILGMGADGHVASLFSGSPALAERTSWVRVDFVERFGTRRMTLTFPILNAAAQVVFLVSGAEKAETLRQVLNGPLEPERLPAQGVRPVNGQLSWYVDEAAAQLL
jgi:6-phosphogluconolactonase